MRWRELIIGGLVTLVVTIVAGVIVWYLTREPSLATEDLKYSTDYVALSSTNPPLGVGNIKVGNIGGRVARNVRVVIEFPPGISIQEQRIQLSSGDAATFQRNSSADNTTDISVPTLAPGEVLTVTALINGKTKFEPTVSVKSDESVGQVGAPDISKALDTKTLGRGEIFLILGGAMFAQLLAGFAAYFARRKFPDQRISRFFSSEPDAVNNTAFMYLQKKQIDEAERMLSERIRSRGGDFYYIANHGLALGLQGHTAAAEARLTAADWLAERAGDREKALLKYNRATLLFAQGDIENGKKLLAAALELHPHSIRDYCEMSAYITEATLVDPKVLDIFGGVRKNG